MAEVVEALGVTADAQGVSGGAKLVGYQVKESAAAPAAATATLRQGTAATDPVIAFIDLAASDVDDPVELPGIDCPTGVFIDWGSGEIDFVFFIE